MGVFWFCFWFGGVFFFLLRELVRWEWEAETLEDKAPSDQIR